MTVVAAVLAGHILYLLRFLANAVGRRRVRLANVYQHSTGPRELDGQIGVVAQHRADATLDARAFEH